MEQPPCAASCRTLLYYPELAKKLRNLDDYPILKRSYAVDKTIQGLAFIDYFHHHVKACHKDFKTVLHQASMRVNQLIDEHGQKRLTPILTNETYRKYQPLMIHGIEWSVKGPMNSMNLNFSNCINLHRLFTIPNKIICVEIEEVMTQTPFMAVRIINKWGDEGDVKWYSLDTRQRVSDSEIKRWKKPR